MRFQNGSNKLVISNRTRAARSFDFEIMGMISDQIALHSVQLPLYIERVEHNANSISIFARKHNVPIQ